MNRLIINTKVAGPRINKNIYGHFSEHLGRCIYEGLYVGENSAIPNEKGIRTDVVEALKKIQVPVLRWPGGCFADIYHWKDGIGPKEKRRRMINTHWGGIVEDNSFGTHEFMELCSQLGCEPYIAGNLGSGTIQEMNDWVEYLNCGDDTDFARLRAENGRKEPWNVKYFGVGNENWGCGGRMKPQQYAQEFRRYQHYLRTFNGKRLYRIACGPNADDYEWTDVVVREAGECMDAMSLHFYTVPRVEDNKRGSALGFDRKAYYETLKNALQMDELLKNHDSIMSKYDPERRIGLIVDEWGTWYAVEPGTNPSFLYQQNTMRDALVAAVSLNIFNRHCDRVVMANLAQIVNVLQSVILTEGESMVLTPTYHVFDLYKGHQGAELLECYVETEPIGEEEEIVPNLHASASRDEEGIIHVTLANLDAEKDYEIDGMFGGVTLEEVSARILSGKMDEYNDFEHNRVWVKEFKEIEKAEAGIRFRIPACSVMEIRCKTVETVV